jgi:predicted small metal-binding protein
MKCGDIVPGCEYVARGQNEDEAPARAAEHTKKDDGMESILEDVLKKVKSAIHDEQGCLRFSRD